MRKLLILFLAGFIVGAMPISAWAHSGADATKADPAAAPSTGLAPAGTATDQGTAFVPPNYEPPDFTHSIGLADPQALLAPVPPDELEQFRNDLLTLARDLASISSNVAQHMAATGFTEDTVNAASDQDLTIVYNAMPDMLAFRMAVNSMRELNRSSNQSLQRSAGGQGPALNPKGGLAAPGAGMQAMGLPEPITDPSYFGTCGSTRNDDQTLYNLHIARNSVNIAAITAEALCKVLVAILGEAENIERCAAFGIAKGVANGIDFAIDLKEFCDGTISDARLDALWENTIAIHKNLDTHDMIEKAFLAEWRMLSVRKETEKNLLNNGELKISLFQLPEGPHALVGIQTTRAIVLDTIQRNQLAGMPIGNAQILFNDGDVLLGQLRYKDAFARYRSAYQAAVNQIVR